VRLRKFRVGLDGPAPPQVEVDQPYLRKPPKPSADPERDTLVPKGFDTWRRVVQREPEKMGIAIKAVFESREDGLPDVDGEAIPGSTIPGNLPGTLRPRHRPQVQQSRAVAGRRLEVI